MNKPAEMTPINMDAHSEPEPRIAPLETFVAPPGLCGARGGYRCPEKCRLDVANDVEAIRWWVFQASQNESTASSRRTAADKLINWSCFQRNKAVSALDREDFAAFSRFLSDPHPVDRWIQTDRVSRDCDRWRPFRRALSTTARVQMMRHVSALVRWLSQQRYADLRCPFGTRAMRDGLSVSAEIASAFRTAPTEEPLSIAEWMHIRQTLDEFYPREGAAVERLIVELLYFGGYSASELSRVVRWNVEPPNRVVPCWALCVSTRSVLRDHVVYAPPPLGDSLARWMDGQSRVGGSHLELRCAPTESLLGMTADQIQSQANRVLRRAARYALNRGLVDLGLRLRERSIVAFRGAFKSHQHRSESASAAHALTRSLAFGRWREDLERPNRDVRQLWDWSHAAHLWANEPTGKSNDKS